MERSLAVMPWIPPFYLNNMKALIILLLSAGVLYSDFAQAQASQQAASYQPPYFEDAERITNIAEAVKGSEAFFEACLKQHHLPGIAYGMVVDDSLVLSGGYGCINLSSGEPATSQSLFRIASMTKSFTAMAILKLSDEGHLSLHEPASKYLPELATLNYLTRDAQALTVHHLLTMTAGFPEDNPWGDRFLDLSEKELMNQVEQGISFSSIPSHQYEYSNLGYGLLGQIISRVSGIPFQDYITQHILEPLGMKHTVWEYEDAPANQLAMGYRRVKNEWVEEPLLHDGAFGSMGGLITSIEDFSHYVSFHLSAWPPRNDQEAGPVSRSIRREMHHLNDPRYYSDPDRFGSGKKLMMRGYGFGLVVMKDHEGITEVGHNGGLPGFGSSYMFYPEYGIGIMAFSNLTYVGGIVRSASYRVMQSLMDQGVFQPRILPASDILKLRAQQVAQLIQSWDAELEKEVVAANLYLDIPREVRMSEAKKWLAMAGEIVSVGPVYPENQLRGRFRIKGREGSIEVYFTLSPEPEPRVQWITLEFFPAEQ